MGGCGVSGWVGNWWLSEWVLDEWVGRGWCISQYVSPKSTRKCLKCIDQASLCSLLYFLYAFLFSVLFSLELWRCTSLTSLLSEPEMRKTPTKLLTLLVAVPYVLSTLVSSGVGAVEGDNDCVILPLLSLLLSELHEEMDDKGYVLEFDFLGKDSIRYYNCVPVEKQVFKNVTLFMKDKNGGDDLFDRLTVSAPAISVYTRSSLR